MIDQMQHDASVANRAGLDRVVTGTFVAAIFLASALLFIVEPLAARLILPVLGGSPVVWITAVAFFQVTLLLGYTYAHITAHLGRRARGVVHAVVLAVALGFLPIALPNWIAPATAPYGWLVGLLAVSVGAPFFVLASASPGLAHWYTDGGRREPYFLYAVSNAGSFVGLLSYPLIIEPSLGLGSQATMWAWGFGAFAALSAVAVTIGLRAGGHRDVTAAPAPVSASPVAWSSRLGWIGLAFIPSSLLLGSTTFITSEIGSVPLLWVVPLATYLMTFVVAFRDRRTPMGEWPSRALAFLVLGVVTTWAIGSSLGLWLDLILHVGLLYAAGLVAHLRLYNTRPDPGRLTEFYLLISLGGALGGVFNAFIAPLIFDWAVEYPLVIIVATALMANRGVAQLNTIKTWAAPLAAAAIALTVDVAADGAAVQTRAVLVVVAIGVAALILLSVKRSIVFALGIGLLVGIFPPINEDAIFRERTFFGILSVRADEEQRSMYHGSTLHGTQYLDERSAEPAAYYARPGPLGDIFASSSDSLAIGIVGLGVGAIAAYGRPGDTMTYFEIDSAVVELAENRELFTYLETTLADVTILVQDGRLGLESSPPGTYDLIILDAFSADAIPVHLLTVEALATYLDRLTDRGMLVIHISNRFFNIEPVLAAAAEELEISAIVRFDPGGDGRFASRWVALGADPEDLATLLSLPGWRAPETQSGFRVWTDDYSNPLSVLR